jgi:ATP-dependent Clp protease ATP-binding subunit ClpC
MSRDRDFKRLVRRRMLKTGESYTTARAHLAQARVSARRTSPTPRGGSAVQPFERFTDPARKLLAVVQQEAEQSGLMYLGTGHLLLALSADPECVAARVLRGLAVEHGTVRSAVERQPPEEDPTEGADMHPTEPVKRAIEFAFTEAKRTDPSHNVGTGHLLLGVLLEGTATGARALRELGVSVEHVRAALELIAAAGPDETPTTSDAVPTLPMSGDLTSVLQSAYDIARAQQARIVELDHLVRAMQTRQ